MRKALTFIFFCIVSHFVNAQTNSNDTTLNSREYIDRATDSIETEGKLLHHSDWTSWYGTDIFLAKCPEKRSLSAGYMSYDTGKGWNNIFFAKGDDPSVIATISFGYN